VRIRSSKGPGRAAALLVASAAVMLAAACGGSSDKTTTNGGGGGNGQGGMNQALTAYVDCMKQNGVTLTLPSFAPGDGASRGPGGYTRPSGQPRPSGEPRPSGSAGGGRGGFPGGNGGGFFQKPAGVDDATWQKAQQACASSLPSRGAGGFGGNGGGQNSAYRNCLQQHGVTMTNGRPASADPKTQEAIKTCAVLRQGASATPTS
jgi:hypothetical protein